MRRVLAEHGLDCAGKTARKLRRRDYEDWDLLIGMDEENLWNMRRLFGGDPEGKLHNLMDYAGRPGEESPTRGTRVILKQHGGTSTPAASACSTSCIRR